MRRMTAAEVEYYAEKQREADERAAKKDIYHGMALLIAASVVPVLCMATENNILCLSSAILISIIALYFICKG